MEAESSRVPSAQGMLEEADAVTVLPMVVMKSVAEAVHPFVSITVTVYVPVVNPENMLVDCSRPLLRV